MGGLLRQAGGEGRRRADAANGEASVKSPPSAAVHEAGHVVAALALGFEFEEVLLPAPGQDLDGWAGQAMVALPQTVDSQIVEDWCVHLYSGWAAEMEIIGRSQF